MILIIIFDFKNFQVQLYCNYMKTNKYSTHVLKYVTGANGFIFCLKSQYIYYYEHFIAIVLF